MKQQIENIIKENLPEKDWTKNWDFHQKGCGLSKRGKWVIYPCDMNCENVLDNFTQIPTSLIAGEVLKVVRNEIASIRGFHLLKKDTTKEEILDSLFDLLSSLSPNKENKNNT